MGKVQLPDRCMAGGPRTGKLVIVISCFGTAVCALGSRDSCHIGLVGQGLSKFIKGNSQDMLKG